MKILIVYYSRTGTTKKVADALAEKLGAEVEEIKDTVDRAGAKGYLLSGRDAALKRRAALKPFGKNPADFDLVIIGTPIWAWTVSTPVRTFLDEHKDEFKKVAFFCTMGGSGLEGAAKEVAKITGLEVSTMLGLTTVEVVKNQFTEKLETFITEIRPTATPEQQQ